MVESQIRTNKVINQDLIKALSILEREEFVPESHRHVAYLDEDLPIGHGRYLMEPMIFARLVEEANIEQTDRVLDFGCGTGYGSAILNRLSDHVVPVDFVANFIELSRANFAKIGMNDLQPRPVNLPKSVMEMSSEMDAMGKFNVILVEAAMATIPNYLLSLLSQNGRLIAVERHSTRMGAGKAIRIDRIDENAPEFAANFSRRVLFDAATPLFPEFLPKVEFQF